MVQSCTLCDAVIIGGGIVGLATARALALARPSWRIVVLEKESSVAQHQTGRNSGVIHSGIYYRPGSAKARLCRQGRAMLVAYCQARQIPYELCGKVIVATDESELPRLAQLASRAAASGVACTALDTTALRQREPYAAGVAALEVPEAGIADYPAVARTLANDLTQCGNQVVLDSEVHQLRIDRNGVGVSTVHGTLRCRLVVACAGLQADRLARRAGLIGRRAPVITPFRGEAFQLTEDAPPLCRHLIYPVPDPALPFLGVHLTRTLAGTTTCGPNAVLALAREGYRWRDVDFDHVAALVASRPLWRMSTRFWRTGFSEVWRSLCKQAFVHALQRLVPELHAAHLLPAPAGVRAQALAHDGKLLDDFAIAGRWPAIAVLNAPSPAATAALAIGEAIAERALN
jgi:L-2-hydroxyglutarate oxidase